MSQNTVETRVLETISTQLSIDTQNINPQARFTDDLGADSLDIIELMMELEEDFDIEIPDEDIEKIHTVKELIDYLYKASSKEA